MYTFPIAHQADTQRITQAPYAQYMAHRSVYAALQASALRHAERTALTAIDEPDPAAPLRRWTYTEFIAQVRRAGNLFTQAAGGNEARVALLLPPVPETHFALWGAEAVGVACPINFQLNVEHIAALLRACGANILVAMGPVPDLDIALRVPAIVALCPGLQRVLLVGAGAADDFTQQLALQDGSTLHRPGPDAADAPAALFHTGGTTGAPKLALHTQGNQLHSAWGAALMFGTHERDVVLNGFPLFHVAGSLVYGLSTLLAGGEVVLPTRLGLRNTTLMANYGRFVEQLGVTQLAAVPTVMATLLAQPLDKQQLRSVRALLTGGSPLPDELAAAFEERHGIPVRNILGMTESAGVIAIEALAGPRTPGACGLPLPHTEVQAQRANGSVAAVNEAGILRVRGPNVSPGYTEAARNAGTFEDGWLVTGDIGHIDAEGRVFVTGRAKDVIIRGAHNIEPGLIESALLRHPAVLMAAAVGAPDAYAGELPVAYVSLKPGSTVAAEELLAFATPHIAERPAVPRRLDIVEALPMTPVGKVYKPALRVLATRRVLQEQLAADGLTSKVMLQVQEAASGLNLMFEVNGEDAASAVRTLMKPYALAYTVTLKDETP